MTQVDDEIKYGMIEAISHLIHRDYEAIVKDFVTLQFIPKGTDLRYASASQRPRCPHLSNPEAGRMCPGSPVTAIVTKQYRQQNRAGG